VKWWIVLVCGCIAWPAYADLLDNRLAGFAQETHRKAKFSETYEASYLDKPVVSQGELEYRAPRLLTKNIVSPESISYTITDNMMIVKRGTEVKQIDLTQQPEIGLGINALRDLLQGNRASLEKQFWTFYSTDDRNPNLWKLVLIPRNNKLLERVKQVIMRGEGNQLREVQMHYSNGDSQVTRITKNE
jgi:hypothetical protein